MIFYRYASRLYHLDNFFFRFAFIIIPDVLPLIMINNAVFFVAKQTACQLVRAVFLCETGKCADARFVEHCAGT